MSTFIPPLSTHTTVPLPQSTTTEPTRVVITFRATRISGGGDHDPNHPPLPQLWTNLPTASSVEPEWRAIPFVALEPAEKSSSTPPPSDWPVLALSDEKAAQISELPPQPVDSIATVETTADTSLAGREYGYTYRVQHPDGGIEWLGSDGSNGSFKFELNDAWGGPGGDDGGAAKAGRWAAQASEVDGATHVNGKVESSESKVVKRWTGKEGEVPGVQIGEQWGGVGISWDGDVPTAHLLSSTPTSAPLSTLVLHPTATPPPIHHVGLPPTPLLLTAEANSFFLATGSTITVRHAVSGSSPSATLRSGRPFTLPAESGLEVLPSTAGETTALLATKSKTVFMYSAKEGAEASVGIELPKTEGHVAVYSEAGKSIVALEEDKTGVVLQALSGPLSTFKVIGLHRVAGSDILVGSVDATTKAHVKMAPLVESNGHKEHTSAAVNGHDEDATPAPPIRSESASSEEGDAESEANEDDPAATDPVQDPSPSSVVAVVLRFFANFWQALLALCGVQSAHGKAGLDDDAVDEADVNGEEAPTEQTPLLSHSVSAHSHLSTTTTLAPSSPALAKQLLAKIQGGEAVLPTLYAPETLFDAGLVISSSADTVEVKVRRAGQTEWREAKIAEETKLGGEGWVKAQLEVQEGGDEEGKGEWEVWVGEKKKVATAE